MCLNGQKTKGAKAIRGRQSNKGLPKNRGQRKKEPNKNVARENETRPKGNGA